MTPIQKMMGKAGDTVRCTEWMHLWPVKAKAGDKCLCGKRTKAEVINRRAR